MTTQQVLVLRDGEGNFYLINNETIEAGRVPEEKKQALHEALTGDVSGFLFGNFGSFNDRAFQSAFNNLTQSNSANANNVLIGGLVAGNTQAIQQIQSNSGTVSSDQRVRQ